MDIKKLENKLYLKFPRIWRCADSNNWKIFKDTNLLSFDWLDKNTDYSSIDMKTVGRGLKSIKPFVKNLKKGDLIFIMNKNVFFGVGIAKSSYDYKGLTIKLAKSGDKPAIEVEYIYKSDAGINHSLNPVNFPPTFTKFNTYNFSLFETLKFLKEKVPTAFEKIQDISIVSLGSKSGKHNPSKKNDLNQILYGPPGTGKTYSTIYKALEIIDGENEKDLKQEERKVIKGRFDSYCKNGRIVFTTFHQSMSYEDFIEGIKPNDPSEDQDYLTYSVQPGIFKKLCDTAQTPNQDAFNHAYNNLIKEVSQKELMTLKTTTGREFAISVNRNGNLNLHTGPEKHKQGTLTKENIQKEIIGEDKFSGWESYFKSVVSYLRNTFDYNPSGKNDDKFILIIDEINRGNVSQIFGELITLIEEDKRIDGDEELKIVLPYSKEEFNVPHNVYIIGTMNTADRSVEALDTALRRRFSFIEMPPEYDLKELKYSFADSDAGSILKTINRRIEKILDKDHLIGHSYFMKKEEEDAKDKLYHAFYKKVIPLLQEYFFGDYGKIGLILGEGFIRKKEWASEDDNLFANFEYESTSDFDERELYEIIDYNNLVEKHIIKVKIENVEQEIEMDFENAIKLLMSNL